MESRTKAKLSDDEIKRLVELGLGDASGVFRISELTQGWFNAAYLIEFSNGWREMVLKVGPPEGVPIMAYEKNILRAEVEAMQLVANHDRIPVPRIFHYDFSRTVFPNDFYIMEFVSGVTWNVLKESVSEEVNQRLEWELGVIMKAINSFEGDRFGYWSDPKRFDAWYDCFHYMLSGLFEDADCFEIALPIEKTELFGYLENHRQAFAEVTQAKLVHWDLWPGNVFVDDVGSDLRITGVIDFERAFWGDPVFEYYFGREKSAAFVEGYGSDPSEEGQAATRRRFYDVYLYLVMVIEDGPRNYDDKGPVDWARERLLEGLEKIK